MPADFVEERKAFALKILEFCRENDPEKTPGDSAIALSIALAAAAKLANKSAYEAQTLLRASMGLVDVVIYKESPTARLTSPGPAPDGIVPWHVPGRGRRKGD